MAIALLEKYFADPMMVDDILELFTELGRIPNNTPFVQVAVPRAMADLQSYHASTVGPNAGSTQAMKEAARLLDSGLLRHMLSVLMNAFLHQ